MMIIQCEDVGADFMEHKPEELKMMRAGEKRLNERGILVGVSFRKINREQNILYSYCVGDFPLPNESRGYII